MAKNSSANQGETPGLRLYALRRFDETPQEKVVVGQTETPEVRLKRRETEATERGFQAGFARGEAEATARIGEVIDRLAGVIAALEQHTVRQAEELAPDLVALSVEIAEKIIHKSIAVDHEIVVAVTQDALRKVADTREQVIVRVNPEDYAIMQERLTRLREESGLSAIVIEPHESISPGGCYIETVSGAVDARIEEQLREADDAVRTALHS